MSCLQNDWMANHEWKSRFVLLFFRTAHRFAVKKNSNKLLWLIGLPVLILYRVIVEWGLNIEIPAKTKIGQGLKLRHGQGLVIHPDTIIGTNVTLRHTTTIGNKMDSQGQPTAAPTIEDNVDIGAHVVIVGPITIGANSTIGAGSVVVKSVPANAVSVGNPAKIISMRELT
jgi:putative colanic acid biosynthesis acetyltransferase WcaB